MNDWYKPKDAKIGDYKAIKNKQSDELALVGKYGEIWIINDQLCGAVITSSRVAKKYLPETQHPVVKGDETRITFPLSELSTWVERLKVTRNRNGMIRMADWFSDDNDE